jgi:hypothetical protein
VEPIVYEAKTKRTELSVASYLEAIEDGRRREDCQALAALMERATGCTPKMWGTSIVGFDSYRYKYPSGHQGESSIVGFSSRKGDITIYLVPGFEDEATTGLLAKLGKHKIGKGCLYIKRLADVQMGVLEELIARSVAETRRRYPGETS